MPMFLKLRDTIAIFLVLVRMFRKKHLMNPVPETCFSTKH